MKKTLKVLPLMLMLTTLSLSSCSFLEGLIDKINDGSSEKEEYKDSFVNTDGETVKVVLSFYELTLLPTMTETIKLDLIKNGEEPNFSGNWSGVTWTSKNPEVATINSDGLITAVSVGEARITAKILSCLVYADIHVIAKELDYVTVENPRKTFVVDKEFVPSFTLKATLKGGFIEELLDYSVDSSKVDMTTAGDYSVRVYGNYLNKDYETSYTISVKESVQYLPKSLDYTNMDLFSNYSYKNANNRICPNEGDIKSLVIPVWFTDSGDCISDRNYMREQVDIAFNGESQENGWESVKTFYEKESLNALTYNATISDWYEANTSFQDVLDNNLIHKIIIDATNWYFDIHTSESRNSYDSDNNGVLDSVCILYGSNLSTTGMITYNALIASSDSNPSLLYAMWASTFEAIEDISNSPADSHTYIHETGHMFGNEDYYDYGGDTRPAGGFIVQEHNTGSHDAYSVTAFGWGKVIVPETDTIVELEDYESSHVSILLSSHPETVNSPYDEYLLLELFAPTGLKTFDSTYKWKGFYSCGPQDVGVRLWHVDSRLTTWSDGEFSLDLHTNPTITNSRLAFSNTSEGDNHGSPLGEEYNKYAQLFNIRNNAPEEDYYGNNIKVITKENLFRSGDSFEWKDFTNQFTDGLKMNNGDTFPWKFSVDSIGKINDKWTATINIERI